MKVKVKQSVICNLRSKAATQYLCVVEYALAAADHSTIAEKTVERAAKAAKWYSSGAVRERSGASVR